MNKYIVPKNYIKLILMFVINLFSPFIKLWEKNYFAKYSSQPLKHQPIFIIGAPRTRSTILYQTITNQLDVLYINNLTCFLKKNLFFGFWLSNKLFKSKTHDCFESNLGNTNGLNSPSECGSFWYRFLPSKKHFINYDEVNKRDLQNIKKEITTVINYFNKPIFFKNLNAGQRLRMLYKIFPNAKIIYIKRDPFYIAQSIILVKRKLKIPDNQYWSIMPRNVEELKRLDWPEQIVKQIYYLEHQIVKDLKLLFKDNIHIVRTDQLQKNKRQLIKYLGIKNRLNYKMKEEKLDTNEKILLSSEEVKLIKREIRKLNWSLTNTD